MHLLVVISFLIPFVCSAISKYLLQSKDYNRMFPTSVPVHELSCFSLPWNFQFRWSGTIVPTLIVRCYTKSPVVSPLATQPFVGRSFSFYSKQLNYLEILGSYPTLFNVTRPVRYKQIYSCLYCNVWRQTRRIKQCTKSKKKKKKKRKQRDQMKCVQSEWFSKQTRDFWVTEMQVTRFLLCQQI